MWTKLIPSQRYLKFTAENAERAEIKNINHKGHEGPQRNTRQSRILEIEMLSYRRSEKMLHCFCQTISREESDKKSCFLQDFQVFPLRPLRPLRLNGFASFSVRHKSPS